jgi:hypothetical protein
MGRAMTYFLWHNKTLEEKKTGGGHKVVPSQMCLHMVEQHTFKIL